jgi:hypothetical protein
VQEGDTLIVLSSQCQENRKVDWMIHHDRLIDEEDYFVCEISVFSRAVRYAKSYLFCRSKYVIKYMTTQTYFY